MKLQPKYIVPNLLTASSLILALVSMMLAFHGEYINAGWFALWCVLLDKADGTAARFLNASSEFGVEFDSLADFMAFGMAPAFLIYVALLNLPQSKDIFVGTNLWILRAALALYVLATALRLARFNVKTTTGDRTFEGLPSTIAGALSMSAFLAYMQHAQSLSPMVVNLFPAYLVALGLLMISSFKLPKLYERKSTLFNTFQIINVVLIYLLTILRLAPEYLLITALLYCSIGFAYCAISKPQLQQSVEECD